MIRRKIFRNTFTNSTGKILSFALQLIMVSYLIRSIGKEAYGSIVLALALAANIQLLEAGFGIGVTKYVAEFNTKKDQGKLLEIVNTNIVVTTIFALIFSFGLFIINEFFLDSIFTISPEFLNNTRDLIRILIPASIIEFWSVSFIRVAEGFQQYMTVRLIEIIKWLLRLIFVFAAVESGYGITGVGYAYLSAGIIIMLVLCIVVLRRNPGLKLSPSFSTRDTFSMLFSFSIWIFIAKVSAFLSYKIDVILIGIFLSPVYLAYYDVAYKIYEALKFVLYVTASALVPVTSELNALTDIRRLELLFQKVTKYTMALALPQLVFALFYAEGILHLWIGGGVESSVLLTQLFVVSLFFLSVTSCGAEIMVGLNRVKDLAIYGAVASVINFGVSLVLIMHIGVTGVVIGTIIGSFVLSAGRLIFMLPAVNISPGTFSREILMRPALGAASLALVFSFLSKNIFIGAGVLAFYLVISTFAVVDKNDRREFSRMFQ